MGHSIVHVEIPAKDQRATGDFYAKLFGWNVQHMPEMSYSTFQTGDGPGGGFPQVGELYQPGDVLVYVSTDDIADSLAQAEALGGKTIVPRTEISPEFGAFAIFEDPAGNRMALHTMEPAR